MREIDIKLFQDFYSKSSKEERFRMCLHKGDYHFTANEDTILRDSYDYDSLKEFLKGSKLEPYGDLLIQYQNKFYDYKDTESEIYDEFREIINDKKQEDKFTNLLIFMNEYKDTNWGLNITFTNISNKKFDIRDNDLTNTIYELITYLYSETGMNKTKLTIDEAKELLIKPEYFDDLKYYYEECGFEHENIDINNIHEVVLKSFAESVSKEREVNDDFLIIKRKQLDKEMEAIKPKTGRKLENSTLGELAHDLSYLIRFERFVIQDEVEHIYDYKIENADLKLIYKYFNFWDLKTLKSNVKNKEDNSDRELKSGFINVSTWISKHKAKRGKNFNDITPNINEIEIDNFRKFIRGDIG